MLEQKKGTRMPVKSAVGSAAAMREVLEAAYSGTCRDPSRNPTSADPTLTGSVVHGSLKPGPPNLARETITRTPAATSPQARLTSPAPRP